MSFFYWLLSICSWSYAIWMLNLTGNTVQNFMRFKILRPEFWLGSSRTASVISTLSLYNLNAVLILSSVNLVNLLNLALFLLELVLFMLQVHNSPLPSSNMYGLNQSSNPPPHARLFIIRMSHVYDLWIKKKRVWRISTSSHSQLFVCRHFVTKAVLWWLCKLLYGCIN